MRDNIALGIPEASDEEIWAAAKAACIDDYVRGLPQGLNAVIGQDAHPSGGQAQRIAIARALLVDAPILVLDEATAFTDPEAEADIQAALTRLVQGKTVLVIAHRATSIAGVDQIAILEAGHLIAHGTPEQLADHPYMRRMSAVKDTDMFELISRLREPLSAAGRTNFRQVTALSCIVGVVRGLSLIAFIPAALP